MKKRLERVILFTVVLLSLCCLFPFNTKALSKEITNTDINTAENFDVGSLSFTDITYKDYSKVTSMFELNRYHGKSYGSRRNFCFYYFLL